MLLLRLLLHVFTYSFTLLLFYTLLLIYLFTLLLLSSDFLFLTFLAYYYSLITDNFTIKREKTTTEALNCQSNSLMEDN